jgi:hypothetical protein
VRARGGVALSRWLQLTLAVENLANARFREHGSLLYGPGTSAVVGLDLVLP